MEVSDGDISFLNLINLIQNRNDANKLEIINDIIENLGICKSCYSDICANVGSVFQNYLQEHLTILSKKYKTWIYF